MRIEMIDINGIITRALVINSNTPHKPCENCGKPTYSHPLLAKNDPDWCTLCDDEYYRGGMSELQLAKWTLEQMANGKAVIVIRGQEE